MRRSTFWASHLYWCISSGYLIGSRIRSKILQFNCFSVFFCPWNFRLKREILRFGLLTCTTSAHEVATSFFPNDFGLGFSMCFFVFPSLRIWRRKVGRLNLLFSCEDGGWFWAAYRQNVGAGNKQFDVVLSQHGFFHCSFVFLKCVGEDCILCKGFLLLGGGG